MRRKSFSIAVLSFVLAANIFTVDVNAQVATESTVTQEMCDASYWNALGAMWDGNVLMDANKIAQFNSTALKTEACNMNDLTSMDASFDATELKNSIAASIISEAPTKPIYANSVAVDTNAYYTAISPFVDI